MTILGIDPGFAITGYGVINYTGNRFSVLDFGVVSTGADTGFPERLRILYEELDQIITRFKPDAVSVEELFFNSNTKTAIKVGHGRGIAILAAARLGVSVYEYTPLQVKQAVAGYGRADKQQMQQMTKVLLGLSEIPRPDDAADALAVAICHAHSYRLNMLKGL